MSSNLPPAADIELVQIASRLVRGVEHIAAIALSALTVLVCVSVTTRYLFNSVIPDTFNLSQLLLGIAVFPYRIRHHLSISGRIASASIRCPASVVCTPSGR